MTSARARSEVGDRIADRFRVEQVLGRGGMGAVYRVLDERLGRPLALKRLRVRDEERRPVLTSLFEREFHTLSQLAHPAIISVYDYGIDELGAFYTMELLDGDDLLAGGRLEWRRACALLRDLASSLAVLHSRRLLHRDLAPGNVRITRDGRAKLIDFGAMTAMGPSKLVVGTPPFVAPEALQLQELDARADLYGLGALAYVMLTGRQAYPARHFDELPRAWQQPPPEPHQIEPSVPPALSQLVLELLHLDRSARPAGAAEVIERLCAIAELPLAERPEVMQAYLATPTLVGRERELSQLRMALAEHARGLPMNLLIEGDPGTGRSRFIDTCVLEAKLLGLCVLRADPNDSGRSRDYGVLRSLGAQLIEALPGTAREASRPWRSLLRHLFPELADAGQGPELGSESLPERRHLHVALRDWLLAVARSKRFVIVVDDMDQIDEPSAALLSGLAHKRGLRRSAGLVVSSTPDASSASLGLLREIARPIMLEPLSREQTETLIRSVFGDVDNAVLVAHRIHELSEGNPRAALGLAQHLVDRRIARYEAGAWVLPPRLADGDLPASLSDALRARIARLSADARELAAALAQTDPRRLPVQEYPAITAHGDHARTYRALDDLVAENVLTASGDRYHFSQQAFVPMLQQEFAAPELQRALHARLARVAERSGDKPSLVHHLFLAGEVEAAVALMVAQREAGTFEYTTRMIDLADRAASAGQAAGMPRVICIELLTWLTGVGALLGDHARFSRHAPALLAELDRDSGLCDYRALDPALPASERLTTALTRLQQRYDATPAAQRGLAPIEAIRELARLCGGFCAMVPTAQDFTLLAQLPSLAPLAALSPALVVMQQIVDMMRLFMEARFVAAAEAIRALLARIAEPDRAGLDPAYHRSMRLSLTYMLGLMEASFGLPGASERVAVLENEPGYRVNAWRVRRIVHLMRGDMELAAKCQRTAELLQLQDGHQQRFPGTFVRSEAVVAFLIEDVMGVKRAVERFTELAAVFPGWQASLHVARSHYLRLQGDAEGALKELEPALRETAPTRHIEWPGVALAHVLALSALGRHAEAADLGLECYATCLRGRITPNHRSIARATIEALTASGRIAMAELLADESIAEAQALGVEGASAGALYESRARVAIAARDEAAFRSHAEQCARHYKLSSNPNPTLVARYERLLRSAQPLLPGSAGASLRPAEGAFSAITVTRSARRTTTMRTEIHDRARHVLERLLDASGVEHGHLYALLNGQMQRLASLHAAPPAEQDAALAGAVERFVARQLAHAREQLRTARALSLPPRRPEGGIGWTQPPSGRYEPVALHATRDGEPIIAAVATLDSSLQEPQPIADALLEELAAVLIEFDDVDAVTCVL